MKLMTGLLLATALLTSGCFKPGPAATVKAFYHHVEKGELDEAIEILAADARSDVPHDKLKVGMQQATREIAQKDGIKSIKVLKEDVIGQTAEVTVEIKYGNGDTDVENNSLIQEGGKWRIQPGINK
ncbi:MAG: DUF4878 domain-containing protein [Acidobacteria bacterium]|nr:DUF4878 domain-containing protein [Acidobacteriota bacterium]